MTIAGVQKSDIKREEEEDEEEEQEEPGPTGVFGGIAHLQELMQMIFMKVPFETLMALSVQRRFLCLISQPQFVTAYQDLHPNVTSGIFLSTSRIQEARYISIYGSCTPNLSFLYSGPSANMEIIQSVSTEIIQSVSGLVLLKMISRKSEIKLIVCNPVSKIFRIISLPPHFTKSLIMGFVLAYNPRRSSSYRIVCQLGTSARTLEIYAPETNQWGSLKYNFEGTMGSEKTYFKKGFFCHDTAFWLDQNHTSCYSFSFKENTLQMFLMPHSRSFPARSLKYVGLSDGNLYVVYIPNPSSAGKLHAVYIPDPSSHEFDLFATEVTTGSLKWNVRSEVDLSSVLLQFPEVQNKEADGFELNKFKILNVFERNADVHLVIAIPGKILLHELTSNNTRVLAQIEDNNNLKYASSFSFTCHRAIV